VGKNGAGKSTLLNMIAGVLAPDSGSVDFGATVRIGYFTQEGRELDPRQRPYDFIHEVAGEVKTKEGTLTASQMMEKFLFTGEMQFSTIGKLSGGERRRLYLLGILMSAPNILLLDEPTNDLDIETLTILEDYLETFPGAVIAVSHDRYFLDKIASSILEVTEGGGVNRYMGNFADYMDQRKVQEKAIQPKKEASAPKPQSAAPKKLRFSFKEQREFETIDDDIAALEAQLTECEAEMDRFASDYVKLQALGAERERLARELEFKTERWVYLNDLNERIQQQQTAK